MISGHQNNMMKDPNLHLSLPDTHPLPPHHPKFMYCMAVLPLMQYKVTYYSLRYTLRGGSISSVNMRLLERACSHKDKVPHNGCPQHFLCSLSSTCFALPGQPLMTMRRPVILTPESLMASAKTHLRYPCKEGGREV
jgi:hypothetical protein